MDIVIFKGHFNGWLRNVTICIIFSTQGKLVKFEERFWHIWLIFLFSAVYHSTLPTTYSKDSVVLFSPNERRGSQWIQVSLSNFPGTIGYVSLIISWIWFYLTSLPVFWIMNSLLSWNFSPLLFSSGSPLLVLCSLKACKA